MEKWRLIMLIGIVLGGAVTVIDALVENVSYMIVIPIQWIAIILIFGGLIMRRRERK